MNWQELLFSYKGRINRAKYWLTALIYLVGIVIAGLILYAAMTGGVSGILVAIVAVILYLGLLYSSLSVAVKRLHDRDKSGWWVLIFYILPGVVQGFGRVGGSQGLMAITSLIALAIGIWAFVELGCLRGTSGDNAYGSDPLQS
jgi:uncharacterized membrane protein YhaH (DUF805 family)